MQPSIIFLGTGGDSIVVGRQLRASGGIIIQSDDCQLHIDPGPGSLVRAPQCDVNIRQNTAVIVSHAHLNHANDVNAVVSAMTYNGLDNKGVLVANDTLVNGIENDSPFLSKFHRNFVERILTVRPGQKIGIEDIEIHVLKANHTEPNALGFRFFTPHFVLSYSGDTCYSNDIVDQYDKSDILILNTVFPAGMKSKENLVCDDVAKIIERTKPKLVVLTHFGHKMIEEDPLYQARELQKQANTQVIAAKDGMAINPLSYSASLRQKTLNLY
jgi:ribonuclease BN (tRNA processing enzyme)